MVLATPHHCKLINFFCRTPLFYIFMKFTSYTVIKSYFNMVVMTFRNELSYGILTEPAVTTVLACMRFGDRHCLTKEWVDSADIDARQDLWRTDHHSASIRHQTREAISTATSLQDLHLLPPQLIHQHHLLKNVWQNGVLKAWKNWIYWQQVWSVN